MEARTVEHKRESLSIKKYLAKSTHGIITKREKRLGVKPRKARFDWRHPLRKKEELRKKPQPVKNNKKEMTNEELLKSLTTETHPDRLKEGIDKAQKLGLTVDPKIVKRYETTVAVRESIKERVRSITQGQLSASTKEAFQEMQTGHVSSAVRDFASIGREGAVGNNLSDSSAGIAKDAKELEKMTGKHFTSVLQQTLQSATPTRSIDTQKKADKTDQNLEGNTTKENTGKQVWQHYVKNKTY